MDKTIPILMDEFKRESDLLNAMMERLVQCQPGDFRSLHHLAEVRSQLSRVEAGLREVRKFLDEQT